MDPSSLHASVVDDDKLLSSGVVTLERGGSHAPSPLHCFCYFRLRSLVTAHGYTLWRTL
jgi:hypothetical protein